MLAHAFRMLLAMLPAFSACAHKIPPPFFFSENKVYYKHQTEIKNKRRLILLSFGCGFVYLASSSFASSCATNNASCTGRRGTARVCRHLLCLILAAGVAVVLTSLFLFLWSLSSWFGFAELSAAASAACPSKVKCVLSPRFCCPCGQCAIDEGQWRSVNAILPTHLDLSE